MTVTVTGLAEVRARLARAVASARGLVTFLEGETAELTAVIDRAWSRRQTPGGARWAPEVEPGGRSSLETAHRVTAGPKSLSVHVDHPAASFQFRGTRGRHPVPPRNPLPFDLRSGRFEPAPVWLDPHLDRLRGWLIADEGDRPFDRGGAR